MKISDEKIEEVREATDIIDVISQYVTLKKKGKSFLGLCPFHTEKTPSFSVDPIRGFYHCFGCGAGGNVFSFVMQMERIAFPEAVRSLAEKSGIHIPVDQKNDQQSEEIEILYRTNQFAAEFFQRCLYRSGEGEKALAYLRDRQFNRHMIERFQIGYAPDSWDQLLKESGKTAIRPENLRRAGLVILKNEGEGYYDRFRCRLMFPIFNPSGRVIGFGGRKLKEEEDGPKYLNTPETQVYQKSRILYGLHQSKSGIRRENRALLVEGYTDLIRLHQCGLDFGVATSGTALTEDQGKLLMRYTKNVTVVFDGDPAGFDAALRGVDILVGVGLHIQIVRLPEGYDPDSYLRDRGCEAMQELLNSAQHFIDFQINRLRETGRLNTHNDKAEATRAILKTVLKIGDPLERNFAIKNVAEKLDVEEALLIQQMRQLLKGENTSFSETDKKNDSILLTAEQGILILLLEDSARWGKIIFQFVEPKYFQEREIRFIVDVIYEGFLRGNMPDAKVLIDRFIDNLKIVQYLTEMLTAKIGDDMDHVDRSQFGLDCVLKLQQKELHKQAREIQDKIRSAQSKGEDVSEYSRILVENRQQLQHQINKVVEMWKKNVEI
ncbi:DNA primase [bacterium]|nr:DNA primase [bacterium]